MVTAVQFFETLASKSPGSLRKLHHLPGSAIFIDEAHAALPVPLWPQAWKWLKILNEQWGCYTVLGSGSLNRFWELKDFAGPPEELPELLEQEIFKELQDQEEKRVSYKLK